MVPQPWGSPLYISLGHLLNWVVGPNSDLVPVMTIFLSVVPAAITAALIYLIVYKWTDSISRGILAALISVGSVVFLSQATILEEYSLAVMFLTLAIYFTVTEHRLLACLSFGLGSAVHVMVGVTAILWFFAHWSQKRNWFLPMVIGGIVGLSSYSLILYLMWADTPRLVAGGLSWSHISGYLGSSSVVGSLAIQGLPQRLLLASGILVLTLGLAVVPLIRRVKNTVQLSCLIRGLWAIAGFAFWYYLTSSDPTTWTFTVFAVPPLVILAATAIKDREINVISFGAIVLVVINVFFLNARTLTAADPVAREYLHSIVQIPEGSAVVIHRGGWEALGLFNVMSDGYYVTPIFMQWQDESINPGDDNALYASYVDWMKYKRGINGENTQEMVKDAVGKGYNVVVLTPMLGDWNDVFKTEPIPGNSYFAKVTGVNDVRTSKDSLISNP